MADDIRWDDVAWDKPLAPRALPPPDDFGVPSVAEMRGSSLAAPFSDATLDKARSALLFGNQIMAGIGRGMTSVGQGAEQLGGHFGAAVGLTDPREVAAYDQRIADEAEIYNRDLGQSAGGKFGNIVGQGVATLPLAEAAPVVEGAGLFGNILRTFAKGAIPGAAAGALQPVEDVKQPPKLGDLITGNQPQGEDFATAKAKQTALGAALGGGANVGLRAAGAGVEAAMNAKTLPFRRAAGRDVVDAVNPPKGPPADIVVDAPIGSSADAQAAIESATPKPNAAAEYIAESDRLRKEVGTNFTPGQETGSKGLTQQEQRMRQGRDTSDAVFALDKEAAGALDSYVTRTMNNISKNGGTPEEVGNNVRNAINAKLGDIEKNRAAQAAKDYGAVRSLTKGSAAIEPTNTNEVLQKILSDNDGVGSPSSDALARFAKKQLANVDPAARQAAEKAAEPSLIQPAYKFPPLPEEAAAQAAGKASASAPAQGNLDKLMELRSYLSKVAGGQKKISGENEDRFLARQLLDSIDKDLDAAANSVGGDVGALLKKANANYRAASQQMDYLRASPLGKLLGKEVTDGAGNSFNTIPSEKIISRIASMEPSEVAITKKMMQEHAPDVWQQVKRTLLGQALNEARIAAPSMGANKLPLQPTKLIHSMGGGTDAGQQWIKAVYEPGEVQQINNSFDAARRLGDRFGYNSSWSGQVAADKIGDVAMQAAAGNKMGAVARAGAAIRDWMTQERLMAAMVDPNGRKALLQLERLPPGSAAARQKLAYLSALTAEQPRGEPAQAEDAGVKQGK